jgi:hypothetical protein
LLSRGRRSFARTLHLPFLDHVHQLDATQDDARTVEVLEPEHWPGSTFNGPMVLLDDVVQILT